MIGCMSVNNTKDVCEQATDANGEGRKTSQIKDLSKMHEEAQTTNT